MRRDANPPLDRSTILTILPPSPPSPDGFAALIRWVDGELAAGRPVTLGDALNQAGARMHGAAILLLALPESIPLPIPSFGAILGVPLIIISAHLALFGEGGELPERARAIVLPRQMIAVMVRYLVRPLQRAERMTQDRMPALARRERLVGMVCLAMSLLLLLPLPFMNVPPALALVCMSWGFAQRDGVFVGLGLAVAAVFIATLLALADLVWGAIA